MRSLPIVCVLAVLACGVAPAVAAAQEGEPAATWRLEQPAPPPPPPGEPAPPAPVALGRVGDIEFWEAPGEAPQANRGLLITHGNGYAVKPGVWAYDGTAWHEIATVCGATNGRIAWAGPADFWTVSDERSGQAPVNGVLPPLEDNSLCHFANGGIVASYAHLAFETDSYEQMRGAACLPPQPPRASSEDCWFGGESLAEPLIGSFHLHWNGQTLEELPYMNQGDPVGDMRQLEDTIFESVAYSKTNRHSEERPGRPPVLHLAQAEGGMEPLTTKLPLYGNENEPTEELEYLRLGATEGVLWAATGRRPGVPGVSREEEGQVTVLRRFDGVWTQVIGPGEGAHPGHPLPDLLESEREERELLGGPASAAQVRAIAPEPGSEDAWLALAKPSDGEHEAAATAVLVHISAQGAVLGVQELPSAAERALPSNAAGAVARLVCPAREDCWMANVDGWLYHLAREGQRTLARSELPGFPEGKIISERPPDEGIPQEVLDAPPPDTSGLQEAPPDYGGTFEEQQEVKSENKVRLPLVSRVHSRLVKGTTLRLSFHLAVKARVRLIAKRRRKVVARTHGRLLKAGNRKLLLRLNRRRWPTKLVLRTHALAPLPLVSSVTGEGGNVTTETTGLLSDPFGKLLGHAGRLP